MENNPSKDVYDLIANLIKTSDEISSGKGEVVLAAKPETKETETTETPVEKKSSNIKIVDNGFINLSRLVSEQKDLMEKLQTKISEFEKEVEIEGAKKAKEPVSLQDLKEELAAFTEKYNNQFNVKIQSIEDNLQYKLDRLEFELTRPKEEKKFPVWLLWLNIFLMLLNSILLLWYLFNRNTVSSTRFLEDFPLNNTNDQVRDTLAVSPAIPLDTAIMLSKQKTDTTTKNITETVKKTEPRKNTDNKVLVQQELDNSAIDQTSKQDLAISKQPIESDTSGQPKDVFFGDD